MFDRCSSLVGELFLEFDRQRSELVLVLLLRDRLLKLSLFSWPSTAEPPAEGTVWERDLFSMPEGNRQLQEGTV